MKRIVALLLATVILAGMVPIAAAEDTAELEVTGKTEILVGESVTWTAEPTDPEAVVTWTAGYPAVATVDENGTVTGHRAGDCHITATAGGVKKTVTIHVAAPELQLAGRTQITVGESVTWTARLTPEDPNDAVTWTAGYPAVATVDENGTITGHRLGDCHITATSSSGARKTVTMHVVEPGVQLAGKTQVGLGDSVTWTAKAIPEGCGASVTWSAGNPAVATVDENGTITTHALGDCHITATASNGAAKTVTLHVLTPEQAYLAEFFPHTLASFDSPHTAIASRTNNLILACKAIDGTVIEPGQVFSFNKTVGERTAEKGYKEAIVYAEGGASTPALGGGVCQVASTIYMCTLLADLDVVERTEHMYAVTYVPMGMDATVYWGSLDYKFRNSTSHPLMLRASVSGGYVHIRILGTRENGNTVKMSYQILSTAPWNEIKQVDTTKEPGYSSTTVTPYTGYRVQTFKERYDAAGKLIEKVSCAYSTYQKRDKVVTVGPEAEKKPIYIRPPRKH